MLVWLKAADFEQARKALRLLKSWLAGAGAMKKGALTNDSDVIKWVMSGTAAVRASISAVEMRIGIAQKALAEEEERIRDLAVLVHVRKNANARIVDYYTVGMNFLGCGPGSGFPAKLGRWYVGLVQQYNLFLRKPSKEFVERLEQFCLRARLFILHHGTGVAIQEAAATAAEEDEEEYEYDYIFLEEDK